MIAGLRRSNFKVGDLDVSGVTTGNVGVPMTNGSTWYVDGDVSSSGDGKTWAGAFATIQEGVTAASSGDIVYVVAKTTGATDTDPASYTENVVIPAGTGEIAIIGVSRGRTQGGLPQLKVGSTTTSPLLTIRAPGCLILNMGFNGASATGGGILLDDDGGSTKVAFGTSIINCHFKNCKVTTKHAETGGAIYTSSSGNAWQTLISGCRFYKNEGDIVVVGTGGSVPQDWVIEDCVFSGPAANVDCNIYTGGSGVNGLIIRNCVFTCFPAIASGTNVKILHLTGSVGVIANCYFACPTQGAGIKTFGAAGDNLVPTTMLLAGNYGEADTEGDSGYVFRT